MAARDGLVGGAVAAGVAQECTHARPGRAMSVRLLVRCVGSIGRGYGGVVAGGAASGGLAMRRGSVGGHAASVLTPGSAGPALPAQARDRGDGRGGQPAGRSGGCRAAVVEGRRAARPIARQPARGGARRDPGGRRRVDHPSASLTDPLDQKELTMDRHAGILVNVSSEAPGAAVQVSQPQLQPQASDEQPPWQQQLAASWPWSQGRFRCRARPGPPYCSGTAATTRAAAAQDLIARAGVGLNPTRTASPWPELPDLNARHLREDERAIAQPHLDARDRTQETDRDDLVRARGVRLQLDHLRPDQNRHRTVGGRPCQERRRASSTTAVPPRASPRMRLERPTKSATWTVRGRS